MRHLLMMLVLGFTHVISLNLLCAQESGAPESRGENAEDRAPSEDGDAVERAERHFEQGARLMRLEQWEAALAEFDASLEALVSRSALFNRAFCLRNLARYAEAIESFERYLELVGDDADDARRAEATRLIEEMRSLLTEVSISVDIDGASISVDDHAVGTSPLDEPLQLLSGSHSIEVSLDGYRPQSRQIRVITGQELVEEFQLEPLPSEPAVEPIADDSEDPELETAPADHDRATWPVFISLASLGVLATGGGTGLVIWNAGRRSDSDDLTLELDQQAGFALTDERRELTDDELDRRRGLNQDLRGDLETWGPIQWSIFAVGVAALTGAIIWLLLRRRPRDETRTSSLPRADRPSLSPTEGAVP